MANIPQDNTLAFTGADATMTEASGREVARKRPATRQLSEKEAQPVAAKHAKKEILPLSHEEWFASFTQAAARIEQDPEDETAWYTMEQVLDKGAKHNFLTASITCRNDSNPATEDEYTPLHYAAARGLLALVSTLVEKQNIPVNTQNHKNKSTPLHLAYSRGHLDVVQFLVDQGADPNLIDSEVGSALHYAAAGRRGEMNRDIIAYLIEKGADFKKTIYPSTSMLDMAVLVSNMPVIEYWEDNYIKSSDSDIDMLTHRALELAKYKLKKDAQGREIQARIIRILKNFLKVRRTNTKGADAAQ